MTHQPVYETFITRLWPINPFITYLWRDNYTFFTKLDKWVDTLTQWVDTPTKWVDTTTRIAKPNWTGLFNVSFSINDIINLFRSINDTRMTLLWRKGVSLVFYIFGWNLNMFSFCLWNFWLSNSSFECLWDFYFLFFSFICFFECSELYMIEI